MLRDRLPALICRLGVDEVGQTLGFGEIDLAVPESPPCKFAGLGKPQSEGRKRIEDAGHHRPAPVDMKLGHSSPVKLAGPGSQSTTASSRTSPVAGWRSRRKLATRLAGILPWHSASSAFLASRPEMRITAMPARPGAVERRRWS